MVGDSGSCHFKQFGVNAESDEMRWLRSSLKNLFSDYRGSMRLLAPIGSCIGDILGSVALLLGPLDHQGRPTEPGTVQSEAELRFAIADPVTTDPITRMVCKCWGYKVTKCTCI